MANCVCMGKKRKAICRGKAMKTSRKKFEKFKRISIKEDQTQNDSFSFYEQSLRYSLAYKMQS